MTREEAIKILDEVIPPPEHHTVDLDHLPIAQAWQCIKETLTANLIRHGHWEVGYAEYGVVVHRCSLCGYAIATHEDSNYCPKCGTRMDGEK